MKTHLGFLLVVATLGSNVGHTQPASSPVDPVKIFDAAAPSVVTINVERSQTKRQGSGVAIGWIYDDKQSVIGTWLATSAHVVSGSAAEINVVEKGQIWKATVEYQDAAADLALLLVRGLSLPVLRPYGTKTLEVGSKARKGVRSCIATWKR